MICGRPVKGGSGSVRWDIMSTKVGGGSKRPVEQAVSAIGHSRRGAYFIVKTTKCHRDGPEAANAGAISEGLAAETDLL